MFSFILPRSPSSINFLHVLPLAAIGSRLRLGMCRWAIASTMYQAISSPIGRPPAVNFGSRSVRSQPLVQNPA